MNLEAIVFGRYVCSSVKTMTKLYDSTQNSSDQVQARECIARALGFRDCATELTSELAALGRAKRLRRGEYLGRKGDTPVRVWLVLEGLLESASLRRDGRRHLLGLLLPGDFTGLISVVDSGMLSSDISSRGDSVVFGWTLQELHELRAKHPSLVLAFEKQIAYRYRLAMERLSTDSGVPLESRVAAMLDILADQHGRLSAEHIILDVKLSQADLADWIGMSRQRVNFALRQLENSGLISLQYTALKILDLQGLKALAKG